MIDSWPEEMPAVFVNFDHPDQRHPLIEQVKAARKFFRKYPQNLHLFLIKPETREQTTVNEVLKAVIANVGELTSFDIVGVTEKELGHSMLDRMVRIARLRTAMDDVDIKLPIHVFGALDPISVCLYFVSGAELFDGLTWLRYSFNEGQCVYTHNVGAIKYGLHMRDNYVKTRSWSDNYYAIQLLEHRLREFEATGNFNKLEPHGTLVKDAVDSLNTRLKRRE